MPAHRRICERRLLLQLTQEQLAARLHEAGLTGMDATTISKLERGLRVVKADEIPYFALALECSETDLLTRPSQK